MSTKGVAKRKQIYNLFEDYSGKQFTHLLDYYSGQNGLGEPRPVITDSSQNYNLGSFIKTFDDNEDPTVLGYDFIIKYDDSPLFNGALEEFIIQFGGFGNTEISSRADTLKKFKNQFNRYFKNDSPVTSGAPSFNGGPGVKSYYLKSISGLNRLIDQTDNNDSPKQFVEYGKDFITLTLNEDVTQNIGNLANLYKSLSYSRLTGRQIIPENLLRFDLELVITEVRKYNRIIKNLKENKLEFLADSITKYVYTLYECQFFFTEYPHGDKLDMSNPVAVEELTIKFNFKWANLKLVRLTPEKNPNANTPRDPTQTTATQSGTASAAASSTSVSSEVTFSETKVDDSNKNPSEYKSNQTPKDGTPNESPYYEIDGVWYRNPKYWGRDQTDTPNKPVTPVEPKPEKERNFFGFKKKAKKTQEQDLTTGEVTVAPGGKGGSLEKFIDSTEKELKKIIPQARLIEKTLADIQSFVPRPPGARPQQLLVSRSLQRTQDFVGRSVKPLIQSFNKNP